MPENTLVNYYPPPPPLILNCLANIRLKILLAEGVLKGRLNPQWVSLRIGGSVGLSINLNETVMKLWVWLSWTYDYGLSKLTV